MAPLPLALRPPSHPQKEVPWNYDPNISLKSFQRSPSSKKTISQKSLNGGLNPYSSPFIFHMISLGLDS